MKSKFTAVVRREEDAYVAFTPDLDIASQGADPEGALSNLREAVALFLECAPPEELAGRLNQDAWITLFTRSAWHHIYSLEYIESGSQCLT